ncbi:MAG TPA: hypothetical protein DEQ25_05730 [Methylophaga sp.]|nr:hypothetical protein [Methylophaga sp.]
MEVSNCCGAVFYEPGWPDNDICSCCREHAGMVNEEEPSIEVIDLDKEFDWSACKAEILNKSVKKYGTVIDAIVGMDARIADLEQTIKGMRDE